MAISVSDYYGGTLKSYSSHDKLPAKEYNYNFEVLETDLAAIVAGTIHEDVVIAKGDILAASAAGTITRLAVGTNAYSLVADNGEATGLKWAVRVTGVTGTAPIASSGGAAPIISLNNGGVTYAKIQNVSATDKVLGRASPGSGVIEEMTCTTAARMLLDDVSAAAMRTTLGLGTAAVEAAADLRGIKIHSIDIGQYGSTTSLTWVDFVSSNLRFYWDPAEYENVVWIKLEAVLSGWGGNTATVLEMYDHTNSNDLADATSIVSSAPTALVRSSGDLRDDANWPGGAAEMRFKFKATTAGTAAIPTMRVLIKTED